MAQGYRLSKRQQSGDDAETLLPVWSYAIANWHRPVIRV